MADPDGFDNIDETDDVDKETLKEHYEETVITQEDMTAERLTELLKHQRIHEVREQDNSFQVITHRGNAINVAEPPAENIDGQVFNPYQSEIKKGSETTQDLTPENVLEKGDLVRLKRHRPTKDYVEYTHGIVVEILGRFGDDLGNAPSNVSLHLYNPQTNDIHMDSFTHPSPTFYDQHVRWLVLVQKANDDTYNVREVDIAEFIDIGDRI